MSTETKFTKGEWRVRLGTVGIVDTSDTQSFGMMLEICHLDQYDFSENWVYNAHLIAAAPKMYDLLKRLTNNDNCKKDIIHLLGEADNLLAQARGEK
jgi:hypothetical protein